MDIKIKNVDGGIDFHNCVRGVLKQDDKFLIMKVNDAEYYHLPGGHIMLGETSDRALVREIKEEIDVDIKVEKLFCISEEFYEKKGKYNQSLISYYNVSSDTKINEGVRMETDKGCIVKNELKLVTIEELKTLDLRPQKIKNLIIENKLDVFTHLGF